MTRVLCVIGFIIAMELAVSPLHAQIRFGTESNATKKQSKTTEVPGIIRGGTSSLQGKSGKLDDEDEADEDSGAKKPSSFSGDGWYGGSSFGSSGLGGSSFGGSGYSRGRYPPGTTPEEIRRRKQEESWRDRIQREEEIRSLLLDYRVKQGLNELLDEWDFYLPQNLEAPSEKDESTSKSTKQTPLDASVATGSASQDSTEFSMTEDERADQELQRQRSKIEAMEDSAEKERQIKIQKEREEARQRWVKRRQEAERGADFFSMPPQLRLREAQLREGWCNLFDGRTFFGWRPQKSGHYGGGRFTIENMEIRSDPNHPGLLYTTNQFGDATFQFEYMAASGSEAFLLLRTSPDPRDLHSSCYAIVLNSQDYKRPRGMILGRQELTREQLQELAALQEKQKNNGGEADLWRRITVQFDGTQLLVRIGQDDPVTIYDTSPLGCGYLGLLVAKGDVRFRNMAWHPGSSISLFDGINPEKHWRRFADGPTLSATRNITMKLAGGPGVVETRDNYDNFVLQFEYNIAYTSTRSGLFFRSMPGMPESGYLMAIQNLPTRQDRDELLGVDVGAFRNFKNARYLRPEDQKWNYVTLSVVGRQFQSWVNGIPVCEASDRRQPGEDQADGPYLNPGPLRLWAPMADTSLEFRNIRITPIKSRVEKTRTFEDRSQSTWEELTRQRRERESEAQKERQELEKSKTP